jgi:hypothetical protein
MRSRRARGLRGLGTEDLLGEHFRLTQMAGQNISGVPRPLVCRAGQLL